MKPPTQRTTRRAVPKPRRAEHNAGRPAPASAEKPQRIAKLLARAGVASRREVERMIADGRIAIDGETLTTPATLLKDLTGVTYDGRPVREPKATRLYRFHKPSGMPHRGVRSQGPADDLRPLAAGHVAGDAGGAARFYHRGAAAAHQRRRIEARARASAQQSAANLPRPRVRRHQPDSARGSRRRDHDRGHQLRLDQRQSRAAHRAQLLDRDDSDRRQEPRGPARARVSRAAGVAADPHLLRRI